MTPAIWQDILTRLKNLRGDMVVQWQGDLDNVQVQQSIQVLSSLIQTWQMAKPPTP